MADLLVIGTLAVGFFLGRTLGGFPFFAGVVFLLGLRAKPLLEGILSPRLGPLPLALSLGGSLLMALPLYLLWGFLRRFRPLRRLDGVIGGIIGMGVAMGVLWAFARGLLGASFLGRIVLGLWG